MTDFGSMIDSIKISAYPDLETRLGLVLAYIGDALVSANRVESDLTNPFRFLTYAVTKNRDAARYVGAIALQANQTRKSDSVSVQLTRGVWLVAHLAINVWKFYVRVDNADILDESPYKRVLVNTAQSVLIRERVYSE